MNQKIPLSLISGNFSSSAPICATSIYWKKWIGGTSSQVLSKRSSGSERASSLMFQAVLVKVRNNLKGNVTSHFHRFSCAFQHIVQTPLMLSLMLLDGVSTGKKMRLLSQCYHWDPWILLHSLDYKKWFSSLLSLFPCHSRVEYHTMYLLFPCYLFCSFLMTLCLFILVR